MICESRARKISERNKLIIKRRDEGVSWVQLSREFKINKSRVKDIYNGYRKRVLDSSSIVEHSI